MKIQIFDPAMCCSTGVCGPSVDPELVRFAADLDWLARQGVEVERYNLYNQARKLGVSKEDIGQAVEMAQMVRDNPAKSVLALANKYLLIPQTQSASCCGGGESNTSDGKCCG
jgi:hypothetical protein